MAISFDDILKEIGEFGRYQKIQYLLLCFVSIFSAFLSFNMVFTGATPEHFCKRTPDETWSNITPWYDNTTYFLNRSSIGDSIGLNTSSREQCFTIERSINGSDVKSACKYGWIYSTEEYSSTIVSQWNLVCDNKWQRGTAKSIFFAGRLAGALIFGQLSDRFGRKPVFISALCLQIVSGVIVALSVNMIMFYVFYLILGMMQTGVFLVAYVMGSELVGPSYRKIAGFGIQYFYSIGYMILAGLAYLIRDWRHLMLTISIPGVVFCSYYWILPESARWLLSNGRREEAEAIIKKAAKTNGAAINDKNLESLETSLPPQTKSGRKCIGVNVLQLFSSLSMAALSFNVWFNWFVNAFVYYGLAFNTSNLGGSPYINFFISGCVEIPAYTVSVLLLDRVGRKRLLIAFMIMGGLACIISAFIPLDLMWLIITFQMLGKFSITASYAIIYLYAAEVFPTSVRNIGMGISSMSARVGGIIAPLVMLLTDTYQSLPLLLFGGTSILAGLLVIALPETMGRPLPETIEDLQAMHSNKKSYKMEEKQSNIINDNAVSGELLANDDV
ncbi:unnamed protein product [Owenia fusiformis]|uniref:Uncharacterized protein n=1 Tax=Owenia fusiformis TaxID=6347 RepID=A0A8J1XMQ0_OWEFU|nr:unnamed protein product [Owenia fusiformis]